MLKTLAASAVLGVGGVTSTFLLNPSNPEVVEGIPNRALYAYVQAAETAPCPVAWYDIAAIGAAESGHGTHAGAHITGDGTITKTIGSSAGAQGPMQFMPDTWRGYVSMGFGDGDGDGATNVNDVDDAANGTAAYLCRSGYVKDDPASVTNAWGAYNGGAGWRRYAESQSYVVICRRFADAYSGQAVPTAVATGPAGPPVPGVKVEAVKIERTPGRLGANLWRKVIDGWTSFGRSENPEVRDRWVQVDRELFGVPPGSQPEPATLP